MTFATNITSIGPFYYDVHPSLTHYYRFEPSDIQGTSVLNYATKRYDSLLVNGASIITSPGG